MTTGIKLTAGTVNKESVKAVKRTILEILESNNDESIIQCALNVFRDTCPKSSIDNATISNCDLNFAASFGEEEVSSDD